MKGSGDDVGSKTMSAVRIEVPAVHEEKTSHNVDEAPGEIKITEWTAAVKLGLHREMQSCGRIRVTQSPW